MTSNDNDLSHDNEPSARSREIIQLGWQNEMARQHLRKKILQLGWPTEITQEILERIKSTK